MTVSGTRAGGSYPQWDKLRADIRGDKTTVGEAIADTDFKKLGSDKTLTMKAGYTFWDVAEAIELSNSKYANADTMDLATKLQQQTGIKDATKVPVGAKLDLSRYFPTAKPPSTKEPECSETPECPEEPEHPEEPGCQEPQTPPEQNGNCQQSPNPPFLDKAQKGAEAYLKKNDKDKDGKINAQEAGKVGDLIPTLDTNGDNKLDKNEMTALYLFQDDPVGALVNNTVGAALNNPNNPFSQEQMAELPKVIMDLPSTPLSKSDGDVSPSERKTSLSFFRKFPALSNLVMRQLMQSVTGSLQSASDEVAGFY